MKITKEPDTLEISDENEFEEFSLSLVQKKNSFLFCLSSLKR